MRCCVVLWPRSGFKYAGFIRFCESRLHTMQMCEKRRISDEQRKKKGDCAMFTTNTRNTSTVYSMKVKTIQFEIKFSEKKKQKRSELYGACDEKV